MKKDRCPCCLNESTWILVDTVDSCSYHQCMECESIFIDPEYIYRVDNGHNLVKYDDTYWQDEIKASVERCWGPALARVSELFYYCRRPIGKVLDIGAGGGYLLDAISAYLPERTAIFYGVEKFPPPEKFQTRNSNYMIGDVADINEKFDAGICMEVLEHLTPTMFLRLLASLEKISYNGSIYLFNTGMPDYVLNENLEYLNPNVFGHIVSYSLKAIAGMAGKYNFKTYPLKGKTWAFILEYKPPKDYPLAMEDRIWSALPENLGLLESEKMGSVLRILGLESARAYL